MKNIKIAVKNANLCGKNMRYAHFAEICEKCGSYVHKTDMPIIIIIIIIIIKRRD